jgi:hypothetical protein
MARRTSKTSEAEFEDIRTASGVRRKKVLSLRRLR